ncbi:MAG: adenosylcobinamide amidohydrolase [Thermodesulfobacteriota bacterium]
MKLKKNSYVLPVVCLLFISLVIVWGTYPACAHPVMVTDSSGHEILITQRPSRVISLVPAITEIIFALGAGEAVQAVTYPDGTYSHGAHPIETVGGFFSPCLDAIKRMHPDMIFLSSLHEKGMERFDRERCTLINLEINSISDTYDNIHALGMIFNKENEAADIVRNIKEQLSLIAKKLEKIPLSKRKRVIRLMGSDQVTAPGDDSFQNECIKLAGGIPPTLDKTGHMVPVTKGEWMRFNPQIIYGCGGDQEAAEQLFNRPGWREVDAVRNGKIFFFPCDLTCRAATNTGYFVSWLSARIYSEEFAKRDALVLEETISKSRRLELGLNYIRNARIAYSTIFDFPHKTLIIDFVEPLSVVSTLEGSRKGMASVGNHYSPPSCWGIGHNLGLAEMRSHIYEVIGKSNDTSSFLFTGADMDNLAVKRKRFRDMEVYAMATGGVKSNAVRMSKDGGAFYEPGTINVIVLPNMRLTPRAMTRAIISATEAKTAALMDMDIRSSYTPTIHQATGTGTDNMIVVEGTGLRIDNAGAHSKMGELIAKAVYAAVQEAVYLQNGLIPERNVFQRLKERGISIFRLLDEAKLDSPEQASALRMRFEEILLQPMYSSFLNSSFAVSDAYERGLVENLESYDCWCEDVAEKIAGGAIGPMKKLVADDDLPSALYRSLNALMNGIYYKEKQQHALQDRG